MTDFERTPILAAGLHREVIGAAFGRCECSGQCGQAHRRHGGRCPREHAPSDPLHAVPRQPMTETQAMRAGAAALMAMCGQCHAGHQRNLARAAHPAAPSQAGLW